MVQTLTNEELLWEDEHRSSSVLILDDKKSIARFIKKITFPAQWSACWYWNAAKHPRGYGTFYISYHGNVNAHRVSYRNFIGPIPRNKEIDHLCRVTSCVNPLHLEVVTHLQNTKRGDAGINMTSKTRCPQGHPYDDENTNYNKKINRRTCRQCNRDRMRTYRASGLYNGRVGSTTYRKKDDHG